MSDRSRIAVDAMGGDEGLAVMLAGVARARRDFPANPAVPPDVVVIGHVDAPPVYLGAYPPPDCRKGKCRMP
ncbi:hypothetical protein LTR94_034654, partial [Friedmanniomyces endolithicus]